MDPDMWSNIILDVSVKVFLDEINTSTAIAIALQPKPLKLQPIWPYKRITQVGGGAGGSCPVRWDWGAWLKSSLPPLWQKSFKDFFDVDHFLKVFTEFVTILLPLYVSVFWPRGMWDLNSPTRDRTRTPFIGRWSFNHWTAREVPKRVVKLVIKGHPFYMPASGKGIYKDTSTLSTF